MTFERENGDGNGNGDHMDWDAEERMVGETAGTPLDPERLTQAVDLSGPAAVAAFETPTDPHVAFVVEQYDGMDHMGGD